MANVINATSTGNGGLITTGDDSGILNIQTNETTAVSVDASQNLTFTNGINAPNTFGFKNRLINGGMVIDQRNAGASVTPTTSGTWYGVDRWAAAVTQSSKFSFQQNAGSVTPPSGFTNYLGVTSLSAYSVTGNDYFGVYQKIEANNMSDLGWGAAGAQSVSLSFWVRSSLTGSFGGSLQNDAENWMYSFAYTISSANTWTYITVTVPGPTSGTWLTGVNNGMYVWFGLGATGVRVGTAGSWGSQSGSGLQPSGTTSVVGTNGATFYVTGVQLEKGTQATSFDFRPYTTELQLCYRYYFFWDFGISAGNSSGPAGMADSSTVGITPVVFPVTMRTAPTSMDTSGTASDYAYRIAGGTSVVCSAVPNFNNPKPQSTWVNGTVASGLTAGQAVLLRGWNASVSKGLGFSAEL